MKLTQGDKLVFIGDSITDCGRKQPVGEGHGDTLGRGYVSLVDALLTATYPDLRVRVVNMGLSGNTVRDLKARWQRDVQAQRPDWLAVMIGINDVWRQFDQPLLQESHVGIDEYEATLRDLVAESRPHCRGLVLLTPFYIEPARQDAMRAMMDRYGAAVRRVAAASETVFVDTQAAFDRILGHIYPAALAWDRVHPGTSGHMVLARAFLHAVEYDWAGASS